MISSLEGTSSHSWIEVFVTPWQVGQPRRKLGSYERHLLTRVSWHFTLLEPLIKTTWELERFSDDWKNGYIIKLPKKGDLSECKNWRGITLLNVINKLISTVLYQRLSEKLEPLLRKEQAGFRPHRSCVDQINTLRIVVEQSLEYHTPLYLIFVDFERVFDSLKHTAIWQTLAERGLPIKLVNIIKELYNKSTCQVIRKSSTEAGKAKVYP
jgi:hypothetical protein